KSLRYWYGTRKGELSTRPRTWPDLQGYSPFTFSYVAEVRLYQASQHFTPHGERDWETAGELKRALEYRLSQGHPREGVFMNLPGPAAWKMIVDCRAFALPFAAEVLYTV